MLRKHYQQHIGDFAHNRLVLETVVYLEPPSRMISKERHDRWHRVKHHRRLCVKHPQSDLKSDHQDGEKSDNEVDHTPRAKGKGEANPKPKKQENPRK